MKGLLRPSNSWTAVAGINGLEPELGKDAVELAQLWDQLALILFFQVQPWPCLFCTWVDLPVVGKILHLSVLVELEAIGCAFIPGTTSSSLDDFSGQSPHLWRLRGFCCQDAAHAAMASNWGSALLEIIKAAGCQCKVA